MKIIIKDVNKRFGKKEVLSNINLKLEPGVYGVLGENGAGKTTLFRCIANLYEVNDGVIGVVSDNEVLTLSGGDIGYLPQKFNIFKHMTVKYFMEFMAGMKEISKKEIESEVRRCITLVNMENELSKKIAKLSGGMIRRLGIAQALLGSPSIILLDEPTVGLDIQERYRFKKAIMDVCPDKIILISTHIVEDIATLCDRIVILKKGSIILTGNINSEIKKISSNIYEISEDEFISNNMDYHIVKIIINEGQKYYRFITNENLGYEKKHATLEDLYFEQMYIKGNRDEKNI